MNVVFRVDASSLIGSGHLMRCLTLATILSERSCSIFFICREYDSSLYTLIEKQGFLVVYLPFVNSQLRNNNGLCSDEGVLNVSWQDDAQQTIKAINSINIQPDWLIIDHYSLDTNWECALRKHVGHIMVIDDLANRTHDCDLLLDQNFYVNMETRYEGLTPEYCQKFLGPQYLLLRSEFIKAPEILLKRTESENRIFIFFGGSDSTHETLKALEALSILEGENFRADVVVGQANTDQKKIKKLIESMPFVNYHLQINNIAELMMQADLAVIAGGGTIWEVCYLSLPAISIMTAENQFEAISSLGNEGIIWNLGWHYEITSDDIATAIDNAFLDPKKLLEMGCRAKKLMGNSDGIDMIFTSMKSCDSK